MQQVIDTDPDVFLSVFDIYAETEMAPWLHEVKHPCLVLTGENDGGCNPRLNTLIAAALPDSELVILPVLAPRHPAGGGRPGGPAGAGFPAAAQGEVTGYTNENGRDRPGHFKFRWEPASGRAAIRIGAAINPPPMLAGAGAANHGTAHAANHGATARAAPSVDGTAQKRAADGTQHRTRHHVGAIGAAVRHVLSPLPAIRLALGLGWRSGKHGEQGNEQKGSAFHGFNRLRCTYA